ncbi:hypothetical protein MMC30_004575 [Trapelia coarctata]|nr:hypothetical protein [Trapelia coarctata]
MAEQYGITNKAAGEPRSMQSTILEAGAAATQDFSPIKQICAHLNAFHVYVSDPERCVEANHYCSHLNEGMLVPSLPVAIFPFQPVPDFLIPIPSIKLIESAQLPCWLIPTNTHLPSSDVRQCLIYEQPTQPSRLIGIEYMISARLFATLPEEERKLWHSHVFEVKSGMLIMPKPALVPTAVWDAAEQKEMEQVVGLYGKTYHLWQVDRGDVVPMGEAQLMGSFTEKEQLRKHSEKFQARAEAYGVDMGKKAEGRAYIPEPEVHEDADTCWKKTNDGKGHGANETKDAWGDGTGHARTAKGIRFST